MQNEVNFLQILQEFPSILLHNLRLLPKWQEDKKCKLLPSAVLLEVIGSFMMTLKHYHEIVFARSVQQTTGKSVIEKTLNRLWSVDVRLYFGFVQAQLHLFVLIFKRRHFMQSH